MAPTLRCLAILHTIISFLCVVGYYYLKVQQLVSYSCSINQWFSEECLFINVAKDLHLNTLILCLTLCIYAHLFLKFDTIVCYYIPK